MAIPSSGKGYTEGQEGGIPGGVARTDSGKMDEFLHQYGLIAVYFGMWIEGETILVITGFLAHQHVFPLWVAYPVAVSGALSVDHFVFLLGRMSGRMAFAQRLHVDESGARSWARRLGDSWLVFFLVRFVYGTRTPFVFYTGHTGMRWFRFIGREIPAVCVWCGVWLFFGNLLSNVLVRIMGRLHGHHRLMIILIVAALGTVAFALLAWRRRHARGPAPAADSLEDEPLDEGTP